ncbi:MAG: hypothetical protein IKP34_04110 [Bacteroidales bacterium]|nr:hypothetical protein [Bacteroidales bacterium]MBR4715340.1 hypothetical protein [Bacteroidales bacterium]
MKKYFLLLFMLLTAFNDLCFCQNAITQAAYPHNIVKTIVREYVYPATVSYVETEKSHYFAYADQSMTVINCEIDNNFFVNDFVIFDDRVYFCGLKNGNNPVGIWGYFDIVNLKHGNLTYNIYENFVCGNNYVDTLHRIVAYEYLRHNIPDVSKHIVVVGTVTDGNRTNGCTIDITPNLSGSTMWNYTIGVTPDVTGERINRICVTDNLVVTAGPATIYSDFDVYRIHDKHNLFATGGPQDEIWHFPLSSVNQYDHNAENYEITHINGDTIATAIQIFDIDTEHYNFGILELAYDMSSLTNGMINTVYEHYVNTQFEKYLVEGLRYDNRRRKLILLLYGKIPNSLPSFKGGIVAEIPLQSINVSLSLLPKNKLMSLDLYNSQNNILCQGLDITQPLVTTYFTQPISASSVCSTPDTYISTDPDFITKSYQATYTICIKKFDCISYYQVNAFTINNNIICSD